MPSVAIGSGSSRRSTTAKATITISGGEIYAQSVGGTAIGGGSSVNFDAADAVINISGGVIIAKSVEGNVKVIQEQDSGLFPTYVDGTENVLLCETKLKKIHFFTTMLVMSIKNAHTSYNLQFPGAHTNR